MSTDPRDATSAPLPVNNREFDAALYGSSNSRRCGELAARFAHGGEAQIKYEQLSADLSEKVDAIVETFKLSEEYRELKSRWAKCMVGSGYSYSEPEDPLKEFNGKPSISQEELRIRAADLACDKSVTLTQSRSLFEQTNLRRALDQYATIVQEVESLRRQALAEVLTFQQRLAAKGIAALSK